MNNTISGKNIFQNEGEIKTFTDKQKLRKFITARPALQEILKAVLKLKQKDARQKHESI